MRHPIFQRMDEGVWKTNDGRILTPLEMDENHRANVLAMIRRSAHRLHDAYTWTVCLEPGPDPDSVAYDIVDAGFEALLGEDPQEWIRKFKLVQDLEELVEGS